MKSKYDLASLQSLLKRNQHREKKLKIFIEENKTTVKKVKNAETGEEKELSITPIHYKKRLRRVKRRINKLSALIKKIENPNGKTAEKAG